MLFVFLFFILNCFQLSFSTTSSSSIPLIQSLSDLPFDSNDCLSSNLILYLESFCLNIQPQQSFIEEIPIDPSFLLHFHLFNKFNLTTNHCIAVNLLKGLSLSFLSFLLILSFISHNYRLLRFRNIKILIILSIRREYL